MYTLGVQYFTGQFFNIAAITEGAHSKENFYLFVASKYMYVLVA